MDNLDGTDSNTKSQGNQAIYLIEEAASGVAYASLHTPARSRKRCIHRVPHHFHGDSRKQHVYEPVVLSIGPYHHGQPQFLPTEEFKSEILLKFMAESVEKDATKGMDFFYKETLENINLIRSNYEGVDEYNNEELAKIILCDTCFLICVIMNPIPVISLSCERIGLGNAELLSEDIWKLENQIPFWVIRHMLYLRFGKDDGDTLVIKYMRIVSLMINNPLQVLPWKDQGDEPLHLLEARQAILLKDSEADTKDDHFLTKLLSVHNRISNSNPVNSYESPTQLKMYNFPCRSITYLQAKGIYLKPSRSSSLRDVKFTSKACYGILQLPILFVNKSAMVFFSNIVAYELLRRDPTFRGINFYVNLMKSLIETPNDVKLLQEKGILISNLGTDEEIVKAFKEIDTKVMGFGLFDDLRSRIEEHCNSKTKTWISDLSHNYFRNPWTVIGLLAATLILSLTFLQTYFTIRAPK